MCQQVIDRFIRYRLVKHLFLFDWCLPALTKKRSNEKQQKQSFRLQASQISFPLRIIDNVVFWLSVSHPKQNYQEKEGVGEKWSKKNFYRDPFCFCRIFFPNFIQSPGSFLHSQSHLNCFLFSKDHFFLPILFPLPFLLSGICSLLLSSWLSSLKEGVWSHTQSWVRRKQKVVRGVLLLCERKSIKVKLVFSQRSTINNSVPKS